MVFYSLSAQKKYIQSPKNNMTLHKPILAFAGSGQFAVPCLDELLRIADIQLVISQPPKPEGKTKSLLPSPLLESAHKHGLRTATPVKIAELEDALSQLNLDAVIVADYGQIIPASLLKLPKFGYINIHPSLLPRHRGPAPISAAILNGDKKIGNSIIQMDEKMDHGPIIAQESYPLSGREMAADLEIELAKRASQLIVRVLPKFFSGLFKPHRQNHEMASYHKLFHRADGQIYWTENAELIDRKFRAYYPWPGVWFMAAVRRAPKIIKLHSLGAVLCRFQDIPASEKAEDIGVRRELRIMDFPEFVRFLKPGNFFSVNESLWIRAVGGAIKINALQIEGANVLTDNQFINGYEDLIHRDKTHALHTAH